LAMAGSATLHGMSKHQTYRKGGRLGSFDPQNTTVFR